MPIPIVPIAGAPSVIEPVRLPGASGAASGGSAFRDVFTGAIQQVEAFGQNASASVERFLAGDGEELHTTLLATQQAELSFDLFLQMRNKVVSAYQEIMRMQM